MIFDELCGNSEAWKQAREPFQKPKASTMRGRRRDTVAETALPPDVQPGDYWKDSAGDWHGMCPNSLIAWLKNHRVVEHGDGTITVPRPGPGEPANSILCGYPGKQWHGFITTGIGGAE